MNSDIKYNIKKAQETIGVENRYKQYFINNKDSIKGMMTINRDVDTIDEAIELINKVDFRKIFGLDVLLEERFICEFFYMEHKIYMAFNSEFEADEAVKIEAERYYGREVRVSSFNRFNMFVREILIKTEKRDAWIRYNDRKNKYVYVIDSKIKNNYVIFDVFDLYQIFMQCDIKRAVQELSNLLGVRIKKINENKKKYEKCKQFIMNSATKNSFSAVYELIGEHIPKLVAVLDEGIDKIYYHLESKENMVFSCSMQYLAGSMNKSKSTISPIINTFVLLHLLEKQDINNETYSKWNRNDITYFYIPQYNDDLFEIANKLAEIMLYRGMRITASSFSYKTCIEKFGVEVASSIFKDKVIKAK
ncbi:hypothetical protein ACJDT4_12040 [Clostridium neuense]|uniref:Uncharacterized protein n=1 Tax=Clostridium neuense TaxID=1728934 RepID=A0ABW8TFJ1_9CLOT